ncbi:D-beta-hydroxybutyrate dehydrogenase, mitochondrial-like isoform X2 [Neocloeon triangulifer]|nr:D-beta-hydroxybutyrate dehydrogenase, mitochondrial-like isoform X2 [Neocloeon triangulifer]XP_059475137.1 D-beta-hydroxybutyrate dehydrogenase, mitochondrial-like isoform X2 [Neocloeon triangulifer]
MPTANSVNIFSWAYNEVLDAVSKSTTVVALYRTYLEWVPFSGGRGIDTTGQIIVAAVSGAAVAAVLCIRWLQMHKGDYRHLKEKLRHLAVFISGCDSGLGYSLAVHCHDKLGLTVFAGCLKPEGEGAFRLSQRGSNRMHIVPLDITKTDSVEKAKKTVYNLIHAKSLELTALVNNAGVMVFGEFDWMTERLMKYQIEVNLLGTMRLTRAFISLLRDHHGRIITVSSHCALETLPGLSVYGATKTALRAWSDGLRLELAKFSMPVITIIPGSFSTQSNIFACQGLHAKEMELYMSPEDKELYGEYFERYHNYLSSLFVDRGPVVLSDKLLYRKFNHALLSTCPRVNYIVSPLRYTIYHTLFKITPTKVRDWLVTRFVQMPEWKQKARADSKPEILLAQPDERMIGSDEEN